MRSPNWVGELKGLAKRKGISEPSYTKENKPGNLPVGAIDAMMTVTECTVWVGGEKFTSRAVTSRAESGKVDAKLKQAAARDAYFILSGAGGSEAHRDTDWELIDIIKLSRRICESRKRSFFVVLPIPCVLRVCTTCAAVPRDDVLNRECGGGTRIAADWLRL